MLSLPSFTIPIHSKLMKDLLFFNNWSVRIPKKKKKESQSNLGKTIFDVNFNINSAQNKIFSEWITEVKMFVQVWDERIISLVLNKFFLFLFFYFFPYDCSLFPNIIYFPFKSIIFLQPIFRSTLKPVDLHICIDSFSGFLKYATLPTKS